MAVLDSYTTYDFTVKKVMQIRTNFFLTFLLNLVFVSSKCYNSFMNLSVGIVGLPNAGKSTLFNALLKKQVAFAANYPFATIEPNIGVVPVPDERLAKLADIVEKTEGKR